MPTNCLLKSNQIYAPVTGVYPALPTVVRHVAATLPGRPRAFAVRSLDSVLAWTASLAGTVMCVILAWALLASVVLRVKMASIPSMDRSKLY